MMFDLDLVIMIKMINLKTPPSARLDGLSRKFVEALVPPSESSLNNY
jgi:hypothetical protein